LHTILSGLETSNVVSFKAAILNAGYDSETELCSCESLRFQLSRRVA